MRKPISLFSLAAFAIAALFLVNGALAAQNDDMAKLKDEVAKLRSELAQVKDSLNQVVKFNEQLCRKLRSENILVFATEPRTDDEKVTRAVEIFKGSLKKMQQAMATRNPVAHQQADTMRQQAQDGLTKIDKGIVIPALKAEVEASSSDFMLCSAIMMALAQVGGEEVFPYFEETVQDQERPGHVRRIAAEAMMTIDKSRAIDLLIPVASDFEQKNFSERFYLIYVLSETKDPRVLPMMLEGAKADPDKSARCHHINGLAHYKTPEARAALEWVIANDDYEHARTNALASLQRMLGDEGVYLLMKKYSQSAKLKNGQPDYRVRNAAYQSMNRISNQLKKDGKAIPGEEPKKDAAAPAAPAPVAPKK